MFQWFSRFFSALGAPILAYVIALAIVVIVRLVVAKYIAYRGDLALIAKGYDPEKINLISLARWTSVFFGLIVSFIIVFLHVGTFPTVEATNDLFVEEDEEIEESDEA